MLSSDSSFVFLAASGEKIISFNTSSDGQMDELILLFEMSLGMVLVLQIF